MPRAVAIVGGVGFIALGVWAMVDPRSFFETLATFEPYSQWCSFSQACPVAPTG